MGRQKGGVYLPTRDRIQIGYGKRRKRKQRGGRKIKKRQRGGFFGWVLKPAMAMTKAMIGAGVKRKQKGGNFASFFKKENLENFI